MGVTLYSSANKNLDNLTILQGEEGHLGFWSERVLFSFRSDDDHCFVSGISHLHCNRDTGRTRRPKLARTKVIRQIEQRYKVPCLVRARRVSPEIREISDQLGCVVSLLLKEESVARISVSKHACPPRLIVRRLDQIEILLV